MNVGKNIGYKKPDCNGRMCITKKLLKQINYNHHIDFFELFIFNDKLILKKVSILPSASQNNSTKKTLRPDLDIEYKKPDLDGRICLTKKTLSRINYDVENDFFQIYAKGDTLIIRKVSLKKS